jgi:hypothetical protein
MMVIEISRSRGWDISGSVLSFVIRGYSNASIVTPPFVSLSLVQFLVISVIMAVRHGIQVLYGISDATDHVIRGEAPLSSLEACKRSHYFAVKAASHEAALNLPSATKIALRDVLNGRLVQRLSGLIRLPAAFLYDPFFKLHHQAQKTAALSQLNSDKTKKENDISKEIFDCLLTSLEMTFEILVRLGLETPSSLERCKQDRRYFLLWLLARLLEAYGSRFAPKGVVYLASQKTLRRDCCYGTARRHFDQIHNLKELLISAGARSEAEIAHPGLAIQKWLPNLWQALQGFSTDVDNALFCDFVAVCNSACDELATLLLSGGDDPDIVA